MKSITIITLLLVFSTISFAQIPDTAWTAVFSLYEDGWGGGVAETTDGDFLVTGYTWTHSPPSNMQIFLLKTDSQGNEIWTHYFGSEYDDYARTIEPTADGGFIITGSTYPSSNNMDLFVIKTDPQGEVEWTRSYDISQYDHGFCGLQTDDGGFILTGTTNNNLTASADILLLKTDAYGNLLWYQMYGGCGFCLGYCAQQTLDGGYIISGSIEALENGCGSDFYLIRTDPSGNEIWSRIFGGSYDDYGFWIEQTPDGGFIFTGQQGTSVYNDPELYLEKMDADGNTIWEMLWCEDDIAVGNSVQNTSDGEFIVTGRTILNSEPGKVLILKIDQDGNIQWNQTITYQYTIIGNCIRETVDHDFIISGFTVAPASEHQVYLARMDCQFSAIETPINESQPEEFILFPPNPNPFNPTTTFRMELPVASRVNLAIYDIRGSLIAYIVDSWKPAGYHQITFDGSELPSGVYIYRLTAGDYQASGKMVLLK